MFILKRFCVEGTKQLNKFSPSDACYLCKKIKNIQKNIYNIYGVWLCFCPFNSVRVFRILRKIFPRNFSKKQTHSFQKKKAKTPWPVTMFSFEEKNVQKMMKVFGRKKYL